MPDEQVIEEGQEELETQAREMGWRPKEEFKGDEAKWVDAKTFVEHGEKVLPIVKETNKRLRGELQTTNTRLTGLASALEASQKTIAALERYHQDDVKQKVERARTELKAQLVQAKKSGDHEAEVQLTDELTQLNVADTTASTLDTKETKKDDKPVPKDYTRDPDFVQWKEENPWFGSDDAKTAIAANVGARLRQGGETATGREYLDMVTKGVEKELKRLGVGDPTPRTRKVESSRNSGGSGGGGGDGKSYSDLPAEAKQACESYVSDLVGENKLYKTKADWQKKYVADYFAKA